MKKKKNLLVTLADENYIEQAKQLFSSVYWNAGWKGDYMLLSYKIPEKKLKWFRDKGILIKKCRPFLGIKKLQNCPPVILDKFYLFKPEFRRWENVIYLDADVIVKASLDELTKIKGFAAVKDSTFNLIKQFTNQAKEKSLFNELKKNYNLKEKSFNAGVLVFNTNMIKKDTFSKLRMLFEKYNKIQSNFEQNTFNLFFYKKWIELPIIYNFYYYPIDFLFLNKKKIIKIKFIIIHFIKSAKPWDPNCLFYEEWKNNLKKAELINIKKPIEVKKLTKKEIEKFSKNLKRKSFIYSPLRNIDRGIGLIGIFLKNNYPRLYLKLKKLKKKLWNFPIIY